MAFRFLRASNAITNCLKQYQNVNDGVTKILQPRIPLLNTARELNFFNGKPAELLWKGVTSVSNPGKKRGRARGLARKKDLNRGQYIGVGKVNIQFPGLNVPVYRGRELVQQRILPPNPDREQKIFQLRDQQFKKKQKLHPLERGWTSYTLGGRKLGAPDPARNETYEDFQSWVLESKIVCKMTGNMGRRRRSSGFVVIGNGKGLAAFALANGPDAKQALTKAKNRSIMKLVYIERYNGHTVFHNFFTQFGKTKLFVKQMPEGYGLKCHRAIKACCEAIGIRNLYAKAEGSRNVKHLVKAFFIGLLRQKSFQQIAEDKKLHLVQFDNSRFNYPKLLASPAKARTIREISSNEVIDYDQYLLEGRVRLQKKKPAPFFTKLPSWNMYLRKQERLRDQHNHRVQLEAEYGGIHSFLTERHPEADGRFWEKKSEEDTG